MPSKPTSSCSINLMVSLQVVGEVSGRALLPSVPQLKAQDIGSELTEELKYFKTVSIQSSTNLIFSSP